VISYSKSNYVLQDLVTKKESTYHITQLKPFKYDEIETDLKSKAALLFFNFNFCSIPLLIQKEAASQNLFFPVVPTKDAVVTRVNR
jgi:hypothetical protein